MDAKTKKKTKELIKTLSANLLTDCERLYKSGGIDIGKYSKEDYVLTKILLTASLERNKNCFAPLSADYKREVKNLLFF